MLNFLKRLDDKYILSPKFLYFFINIQFYTLHQFRGNFATDHFKITKTTYSNLLGLLLFITFFTNIGLATLNDRFQRPRLCVIGLLCMSCFFFQLFFIDSYMNLFGFKTFMFWMNLLLYLCLNTSIPPLLDKITLEHLQSVPNVGAKTYGKQRLWGTIGYLIANLIIEKTLLVSAVQSTSVSGSKQKKNYKFTNLRYYHILTTAIASFFSFFLIKVNIRDNGRRNDLMQSWGILIRNKEYIFFIFIILLNGITRSAMTNFLGIYLTDIVKLSGYDISGINPIVRYPINLFNESPISTTSFFGVILEIAILWHASKIITRFGLYWPLLFAQVFQLLRFSCYFFMNHEATHAFALVCSFELMKGINFGLTHIAAVQIATKLSPPHLKTTSQMIYSGTFTGLASVFSGFIFGKVFSKEKMEGKGDAGSIEKRITNFNMFFVVNIVINICSIIMFIYKYGMVDKTLSLDVFKRRTSDENEEDDMEVEKKKKKIDLNREDEDLKEVVVDLKEHGRKRKIKNESNM